MVLCVAVTVAFGDTTLIGNAYGKLVITIDEIKIFLAHRPFDFSSILIY